MARARSQTGIVYTRHFFTVNSREAAPSAEVILPLVFELLHPESMADVGCGTGEWLRTAQSLGIHDVIGFDGTYVEPSTLNIPVEQFVPCDLTRPLPTNRRFDLVLCLEVAEHLPEAVAAGLVSELVRIGRSVLFSAAIPQQPGTHHVNCQWPGYWAELFRLHRYVFCDCIRPLIWDDSRVSPCYAQNAFLVLPCDVAMSISNPAAIDSVRPLVHPRYWEYTLAIRSVGNVKVSELLRALPAALVRSIRFRLAAAVSRAFEANSFRPMG